MKSAPNRKLASNHPQAPAGVPGEAARSEVAALDRARLAARLRDLGRRLALLDDSLGADATDAPLFELDGVRSGIEEAAVACGALREPGASALEEAVKRLAWAVQSLEACRELDDTFSARLDEVRARLASVSMLLGLPDSGE